MCGAGFIAVVSAVDPLVRWSVSWVYRGDVTVSGAAASNSRYGDGPISLHAAIEEAFAEVRETCRAVLAASK